MVNLLYPYTIAVRRSKTNAVSNVGAQQVGLTGYSGREQSTNTSDVEGEVVLFTNIPALIVAYSPGRIKNPLIPSDYSEKTVWQIFIPSTALARFSIRDRDTILDDEGYRYGVVQNYWTIVGYQLTCIRLEA